MPLFPIGIINIGVRDKWPPQRNQLIRFTNGVALSFVILMTFIITILSVMGGLVKVIVLASVVTVFSILPTFYLNYLGRYLISRLILGYLFPFLCFIVMVVTRVWVDNVNFSIIDAFGQELFLLMLILIPLNLYDRRKWSYYANCTFVLLLIILHNPVHELLGVGVSEIYPEGERYFILVIFLFLLGATMVVLVDVKSRITEMNVTRNVEQEKVFVDKVINSMPGVFYLYKLFGEEFKLVKWNKNHETVTGYSHEELFHMVPLSFFYENEHERIRDEIGRVIIEGKGNVEANFKLKNGQIIPYYFEGFRFELEDDLYFLGMGIDISHRINAEKDLFNSEKRLKAAQRIAKVGDWELDLKNNEFTHWSDEMYHIFGLPKESKNIPFQLLEDMIHPDDKLGALGALELAVNSKSERFNIFHRIIRFDGEEVYLEISAQNITDENGLYIKTIGTVADITTFKKIEIELQESEKKLKNAQAMAHVGNWEYDVTNDVNIWSEETYKIYEFPTHERVSFERLKERIHPEDLENVEKAYNTSAENKTDYKVEHKIKIGNKIKYVQQRGVHIFNDDGKLLKTVGTTQDITDMKLSEIALKNSESRFRSYLNNAPNGIFLIDERGYFVDHNPAIEKMTGFSEDELRLKKFEDLDPSEGSRALVNEHFKQLNEQGSAYFEAPFYKKTGEKRYWSINAVRLGEDNFLAFTQDITDRIEKDKKIQVLAQNLEIQNEKLQVSLDTGNLIAWEYDLINREIRFYPEGKELRFFNLKKPFGSFKEVVRGVHVSQRALIDKKMNAHIKGESDHFDVELMVRTRIPNTWKWIFVTGKIIKRDREGKPMIAYGIMQDIDWKKSIENILLQGQEMERKRVSTEIHDSIGQMLIGTRFLVRKSLKTVRNDDTREIDQMLDQIIKETRMIINNLGVSLFEEDSLKEAIKSLITKMDRLTYARINLKWNGSPEVKDPSIALNIFRILQESVSNAIKYSDSKNINIDVINRGTFTMEIVDDGRGFEINGKPTGFGIDNMRKRAISIDGKLEISSDPGKGTRIQLEI